MDDLIYSNKRKNLWLLLVFVCGLIMCWAYRNGRLNETIYTQLEKVRPGMFSETTQTITELEEYYVPCEYVYVDDMCKDEFYVKQEGSVGEKSVTVMSFYVNGEEVEQKVIETEIINKAEPRIVCVGTKEPEEYICPLDEGYVITSHYGPRWGRSHDGIDLGVDVGNRVYASATGTVILAQWYYGYGNCIDVDHGNGIVTRYAHLDSISVSEGDTVYQGQVIGESGNTGNSTGPHLHFEIRINNESVNPADYVDM